MTRVHSNHEHAPTRINLSYTSCHTIKYTETLLTQLNITNPYALFCLLKDFLKVNTCKATRDAGHQDSHHSHKLRVCSQDLLLSVINDHCRPLWGLEHRHTELQMLLSLV